MFLVDDIVKGFTEGGVKGVAESVVSLVKQFHSSPEDIAKVEAAAKEFTLKQAEIAAKDRDSARQREVQVKDNVPRNLAYLYTGFFFGVIVAELGVGMVGVILPEYVQRTLDMLFGVLLATVVGIKEYYFGTSASEVKANNGK